MEPLFFLRGHRTCSDLSNKIVCRHRSCDILAMTDKANDEFLLHAEDPAFVRKGHQLEFLANGSGKTTLLRIL